MVSKNGASKNAGLRSSRELKRTPRDHVTGVFRTKYSETGKSEVLEQHVRITGEQLEDGGKRRLQPCRKFKMGLYLAFACKLFPLAPDTLDGKTYIYPYMGLCKYGKRCKYSHGEQILIPQTIDKSAKNLHNSDEIFATEKIDQEVHGVITSNRLKERLKSLPVTHLTTTTRRTAVGFEHSSTRRRVVRDDDGNIVEVVKRRSGVTDTLLPAKKSKCMLDANRTSERPWTNT